MSRKILHRGVVVQGYQIDRVLGQGGFGITYLATELANMSYVAIKEYFPKSFASRDTGNTIRPITGNENQRVFSIGLKGFLEEARVLARLDHPNVIKVKSIFKANGTAYFVMEYCEGGELYSNCNLHRLSTEKQIAEVVLIITDALDFCHSKGIVHRDIKVLINLFSLKISSGRPKTKRQS